MGIVERQIEAAQKAGAFDSLPGAGKPIPDIGRQRPDGWWAQALVERERGNLRRDELRDERAGLFVRCERSESLGDARALAEHFNARVARHNHAFPSGPVDPVDLADVERRYRVRGAGRT